jgi:hypothetical protein
MEVETEAPRVESVQAVVRDGALTLLVDETIYSREAVLRACYWFTDAVTCSSRGLRLTS